MLFRSREGSDCTTLGFDVWSGIDSIMSSYLTCSLHIVFAQFPGFALVSITIYVVLHSVNLEYIRPASRSCRAIMSCDRIYSQVCHHLAALSYSQYFLLAFLATWYKSGRIMNNQRREEFFPHSSTAVVVWVLLCCEKGSVFLRGNMPRLSALFLSVVYGHIEAFEIMVTRFFFVFINYPRYCPSSMNSPSTTHSPLNGCHFLPISYLPDNFLLSSTARIIW